MPFPHELLGGMGERANQRRGSSNLDLEGRVSPAIALADNTSSPPSLSPSQRRVGFGSCCVKPIEARGALGDTLLIVPRATLAAGCFVALGI